MPTSSLHTPTANHLRQPAKRRRLSPIHHSQQVLNLRPRPRVPRLRTPAHGRGPEPGPPQLSVRGGRVPEAGPRKDPGRAGEHRRVAVGGVPEDAEAGGLREGHRGRRVQRHHLGRGG